MITNSQKKTLTNVIRAIREKLSEAKFYLRQMKKKKVAQRTFRYYLSAFLSASDSVTEFMELQGKRYERQKRKNKTFEQWFHMKQNLFRTPYESNNKSIGTDSVWVYLRALRHETIHIQPIKVSTQLEFQVNAQLIVREDKSGCIQVIQDDGSILQYEFAPGQPPELPIQLFKSPKKSAAIRTELHTNTKVEPVQIQQLPMLRAVDTGKVLWVFTPLTIISQGKSGESVLNPPTDDVVTVCQNHIKKLEALIEECKTILQ